MGKRNRRERVKFYSATDLSCGSYLKRLLDVVRSFDANNNYSIVDVIEFYNISRFIDNRVFLKVWNEDTKTFLESSVILLKRKIGKFFSTITSVELASSYAILDYYYKEDFWVILEKYKTLDRLGEDGLIALLENNPPIRYILRCKNIVRKYDSLIRDFILKEESNAELLVTHFETHSDNKIEIFLPASLSNMDKEELIKRYISSKKPNLNTLRLINNIMSKKDAITLSDKTKYLSIKRTEEIEREIFSKENSARFGCKLYFCEHDEYATINIDGNTTTFTYDIRWIKENLDFNTLLNNFIYLFEYTDLQMRVTLVSLPDEMGIMEKMITGNAKNSYNFGMVFRMKDMTSTTQLKAYRDILNEEKIHLEDIMSWFFEKYLLDEFNIEDFRLTMPSENSTYLEKCRAILPEIESVLKQYNLFVEDTTIDHNLLQITSEHLLLKNCKSLLENKYVYATGQLINDISFLLFSDQCMLAHVDRIDVSYHNFYELINNNKILLSDYPEYEQPNLEYLRKNNIVKIVDDCIAWVNNDSVWILKELYYMQCISYWRLPKRLRKIVEDLVIKDLVVFESSLFSKPEQDYLNYHLNKSTFNNSLDLRNKYSHGTQPSGLVAEEEHLMHYIVFLKIMILVIIKINDDLCLFDENVKNRVKI